MATGKVLGCSSVNAYITEVGGGQRLAEVGITALAHRRTLDEISDCRMSLSAGQNDRCEKLLAELEPWIHEISIYRDAEEVWVGPVTEPTFTYRDAAISGRDLFQWFERRVLPHDRTFTQTDLSTIAAQYLVDALEIDTSPNINFSVAPCGVLGDRSVLAITYRRAADEVRELARGGLDFTTIGRTVRFGGKEVSAPRLPVLTESIFEIDSMRLAGVQAGNHVIVLGATPPGVTTPLVGTAGGADQPVVTLVFSEPSILDVPSATAAAETRFDLLRQAPVFISGRLLESAPVSYSDLIPGAIAPIRQQVGFRYVDDEYRLMSVESNYDLSAGLKETVRCIFQPTGTLESF